MVAKHTSGIFSVVKSFDSESLVVFSGPHLEFLDGFHACMTEHAISRFTVVEPRPSSKPTGLKTSLHCSGATVLPLWKVKAWRLVGSLISRASH